MKKELIRFALIIVVLIYISVFIYPTLYLYTDYDNKLPVKTNRITGKSWIFVPSDGWRIAEKEDK
jgi:hypothetical protein